MSYLNEEAKAIAMSENDKDVITGDTVVVFGSKKSTDLKEQTMLETISHVYADLEKTDEELAFMNQSLAKCISKMIETQKSIQAEPSAEASPKNDHSLQFKAGVTRGSTFDDTLNDVSNSPELGTLEPSRPFGHALGSIPPVAENPYCQFSDQTNIKDMNAFSVGDDVEIPLSRPSNISSLDVPKIANPCSDVITTDYGHKKMCRPSQDISDDCYSDCDPFEDPVSSDGERAEYSRKEIPAFVPGSNRVVNVSDVGSVADFCPHDPRLSVLKAQPGDDSPGVSSQAVGPEIVALIYNAVKNMPNSKHQEVKADLPETNSDRSGNYSIEGCARRSDLPMERYRKDYNRYKKYDPLSIETSPSISASGSSKASARKSVSFADIEESERVLVHQEQVYHEYYKTLLARSGHNDRTSNFPGSSCTRENSLAKPDFNISLGDLTDGKGAKDGQGVTETELSRTFKWLRSRTSSETDNIFENILKRYVQYKNNIVSEIPNIEGNTSTTGVEDASEIKTDKTSAIDPEPSVTTGNAGITYGEYRRSLRESNRRPDVADKAQADTKPTTVSSQDQKMFGSRPEAVNKTKNPHHRESVEEPQKVGVSDRDSAVSKRVYDPRSNYSRTRRSSDERELRDYNVNKTSSSDDSTHVKPSAESSIKSKYDNREAKLRGLSQPKGGEIKPQKWDPLKSKYGRKPGRSVEEDVTRSPVNPFSPFSPNKQAPIKLATTGTAKERDTAEALNCIFEKRDRMKEIASKLKSSKMNAQELKEKRKESIKTIKKKRSSDNSKLSEIPVISDPVVSSTDDFVNPSDSSKKNDSEKSDIHETTSSELALNEVTDGIDDGLAINEKEIKNHQTACSTDDKSKPASKEESKTKQDDEVAINDKSKPASEEESKTKQDDEVAINDKSKPASKEESKTKQDDEVAINDKSKPASEEESKTKQDDEVATSSGDVIENIDKPKNKSHHSDSLQDNCNSESRTATGKAVQPSVCEKDNIVEEGLPRANSSEELDCRSLEETEIDVQSICGHRVCKLVLVDIFWKAKRDGKFKKRRLGRLARKFMKKYNSKMKLAQSLLSKKIEDSKEPADKSCIGKRKADKSDENQMKTQKIIGDSENEECEDVKAGSDNIELDNVVYDKTLCENPPIDATLTAMKTRKNSDSDNSDSEVTNSDKPHHTTVGERKDLVVKSAREHKASLVNETSLRKSGGAKYRESNTKNIRVRSNARKEEASAQGRCFRPVSVPNPVPVSVPDKNLKRDMEESYEGMSKSRNSSSKYNKKSSKKGKPTVRGNEKKKHKESKRMDIDKEGGQGEGTDTKLTAHDSISISKLNPTSDNLDKKVPVDKRKTEVESCAKEHHDVDVGTVVRVGKHTKSKKPRKSKARLNKEKLPEEDSNLHVLEEDSVVQSDELVKNQDSTCEDENYLVRTKGGFKKRPIKMDERLPEIDKGNPIARDYKRMKTEKSTKGLAGSKKGSSRGHDQFVSYEANVDDEVNGSLSDKSKEVDDKGEIGNVNAFTEPTGTLDAVSETTRPNESNKEVVVGNFMYGLESDQSTRGGHPAESSVANCSLPMSVPEFCSSAAPLPIIENVMSLLDIDKMPNSLIEDSSDSSNEDLPFLENLDSILKELSTIGSDNEDPGVGSDTKDEGLCSNEDVSLMQNDHFCRYANKPYVPKTKTKAELKEISCENSVRPVGDIVKHDPEIELKPDHLLSTPSCSSQPAEVVLSSGDIFVCVYCQKPFTTTKGETVDNYSKNIGSYCHNCFLSVYKTRYTMYKRKINTALKKRRRKKKP